MDELHQLFWGGRKWGVIEVGKWTRYFQELSLLRIVCILAEDRDICVPLAIIWPIYRMGQTLSYTPSTAGKAPSPY